MFPKKTVLAHLSFFSEHVKSGLCATKPQYHQTKLTCWVPKHMIMQLKPTQLTSQPASKLSPVSCFLGRQRSMLGVCCSALLCADVVIVLMAGDTSQLVQGPVQAVSHRGVQDGHWPTAVCRVPWMLSHSACCLPCNLKWPRISDIYLCCLTGWTSEQTDFQSLSRPK